MEPLLCNENGSACPMLLDEPTLPIHQDLTPANTNSSIILKNADETMKEEEHAPLLSNVLPEIRHEVLRFLDSTDLANMSMVSRQSRTDCARPDLSQQRTALIDCKPCPIEDRNMPFTTAYGMHPLVRALLKLPLSSDNNLTFQSRFTRMQVRAPTHLQKINNREAKPIIKSTAFTHITDLDVSCTNNTERHASLPQQTVAPSIVRLLLQLLPNVRDVDLSYSRLTTAICADIGRHARTVTRLRFVGSWLAVSSITLVDLKECNRRLTELDLTNATLAATAKEESDLLLDLDLSSDVEGEADHVNPNLHPSCPLIHVLANVQGLRLKGCRYVNMTALKHAQHLALLEDPAATTLPTSTGQPMTQLGLMKIVRHAKNLKWMESDLTRENVELLKQERPEIDFR